MIRLLEKKNQKKHVEQDENPVYVTLVRSRHMSAGLEFLARSSSETKSALKWETTGTRRRQHS